MKKKIILIVIAIIISIAINFFTFKNGHNWGDDFAAYIIQSQTIKNNSFDDLIFHIKHTKYILNYPWGYPMLLAPVIEHFETNINFLKMYTYCFFIISFIFIYLFFRNNDKEMALLTILMISVNPYFWEFKNNILADFSNLLFTYIALYLINLILLFLRL